MNGSSDVDAVESPQKSALPGVPASEGSCLASTRATESSRSSDDTLTLKASGSFSNLSTDRTDRGGTVPPSAAPVDYSAKKKAAPKAKKAAPKSKSRASASQSATPSIRSPASGKAAKAAPVPKAVAEHEKDEPLCDSDAMLKVSEVMGGETACVEPPVERWREGGFPVIQDVVTYVKQPSSGFAGASPQIGGVPGDLRSPAVVQQLDERSVPHFVHNVSVPPLAIPSNRLGPPPKFRDRFLPVAFKQTVQPIEVEVEEDVLEIEFRRFVPKAVPVDVLVERPVICPTDRGKQSLRHRKMEYSEVDVAQYNQVLLNLNSHIQDAAVLRQLPFRQPKAPGLPWFLPRGVVPKAAVLSTPYDRKSSASSSSIPAESGNMALSASPALRAIASAQLSSVPHNDPNERFSIAAAVSSASPLTPRSRILESCSMAVQPGNSMSRLTSVNLNPTASRQPSTLAGPHASIVLSHRPATTPCSTPSLLTSPRVAPAQQTVVTSPSTGPPARCGSRALQPTNPTAMPRTFRYHTGRDDLTHVTSRVGALQHPLRSVSGSHTSKERLEMRGNRKPSRMCCGMDCGPRRKTDVKTNTTAFDSHTLLSAGSSQSFSEDDHLEGYRSPSFGNKRHLRLPLNDVAMSDTGVPMYIPAFHLAK